MWVSGWGGGGWVRSLLSFPVFTWVHNVMLDCGARFTQRMDFVSATSASSQHVIGHELR